MIQNSTFLQGKQGGFTGIGPVLGAGAGQNPLMFQVILGE
ncbi:hypothetical protein Holit_02692 [Hollandina sp. SP2]